MPQSKELTEFYQAYAKWLDEGAPIDGPFLRYEGLCGATHGTLNGIKIRRELRQQFAEAGFPMKGRHYFPFNNSTGEFLLEVDERRSHLNPLRIKWVRDHCNPQD